MIEPKERTFKNGNTEIQVKLTKDEYRKLYKEYKASGIYNYRNFIKGKLLGNFENKKMNTFIVQRLKFMLNAYVSTGEINKEDLGHINELFNSIYD